MRPQRSAQLPSLDDAQARLVRAIDDGASFHDMWALACEMAAAQSNHVRRAFAEDAARESPMQILFHTMSRPFLRSLVLGTVAHDLHEDHSAHWRQTYPMRHAGSYAVGLVVQDRGAFLTKAETRQLVQRLRQYAAAVEYMDARRADDAYGNSQVTDAEREVLETVMAIDNRYLKAHQQWEEGDPFRMPRFAGSRQQDPAGHIRQLVAMFERRVLADGPDHVAQLSSPLYVGCAGNLAARTPHHDQRASGGVKLLHLTQSCMAYCGFSPRTVAAPALWVWEEEHVPLAEMLVTVLAGSLVAQGGFNAVAPGSNRPDLTGAGAEEMLQTTQDYVYGERPFFQENLRQTVAQHGTDPAPEDRFTAALAEVDEPPTLHGMLQTLRRLPDRVQAMRDLQQRVAHETADLEALGREVDDALGGDDPEDLAL